MNITVNTAELQTKLEIVARVSIKNATLPVLQCVLIEVKKEHITLKATNLEIGIEATISGTVTAFGKVAVPAQTLIQTINLHTGREVILQVIDGALVIEGGGSKTKITLVSAEEFPSIPKLETKKQTISSQMFALGLKTTAFAVSQSAIKPELSSVYIFQKKEHGLTFVATDSFRLMEKTVAQPKLALETSLLLPGKNAIEITRVLEAKADEVQFQVTENQCSFTRPDGVYITSRLINGSFPDYNQIIPKEYTAKTTVLRKDIMQAFKKTNIFLNKFMQVTLTATKQNLTLSTKNNEVGTTTELVAATTTGEDITLSFNQRYIAEALGHFVDDSIVLQFAGVGRPVVVVGVSDVNTKYLVMPMNK